MTVPDKLFQLMNLRTDIYEAGKREKDSFSRQTVPTRQEKKRRKKDSLTRDKRNFPDLVGFELLFIVSITIC